MLEEKKSYEIELEGLRKIKRVYKKDWQPFANFLKNFDWGEDVHFYYESLWYIKIRYKGEYVSIKQDTIDKDFVEKIEKTNPERVIKESYSYPRVIFNVAEFYEEIQKMIGYKQKNLETVSRAIDNFEKITEELYKRIKGVMDYLDTLGDKYYDFREIASETLKHYYK